MKTIFHRHSIRKYLDIPVDKSIIEKLLRAAMAAPSACNQQPWEYYVVTVKDKILELSQTSPYAGCAAAAPVVLVPCYRTEGLICPQYSHIDMSASVENLLLEADYNRLGAVWLGIAPEKDRMANVAKVLDLPANLAAFALIPCGYPMEETAAVDCYDLSRIHFCE